MVRVLRIQAPFAVTAGSLLCLGGKGGNSVRRLAAAHGGRFIRIWWIGKRFILLPAPAAENHFKAMVIVPENFVPMPVILQPGSEGVRAMNREQFDREKKYQAALAVARSMLRQNVINEKDFFHIEGKLREKFKPVSGGFLL